MGDARVIGVFLEQRLKDARRLELIGEGLVGGQGGHVQDEGIENLCFHVIGIASRHGFHGLLEGQRARSVFSRLPILEEDGERSDIVAFALGLGADALGLRTGRGTRLQRVRVGRPAERIAHRHDRDAPVRHPAFGIVLQDFGKRFFRRVEPEGMEQRHRPVELFLCGGVTGNRKVHLPESFPVCRCVVRALRAAHAPDAPAMSSYR